MTQPPKIGVVGAGAVGCYVGCRLASVGADVVYFGRERIADEVAEHGLCALDVEGRRTWAEKSTIVFSTSPQALVDCEVLLCCVKSLQTAEVATTIAAVARPDAIVVSLQNGVGNTDVLRAGVGGRKVFGGIVGFNVRALGRGAFQQATSGNLVIEGEEDRTNGTRIAAVASLLSLAGFDVQVVRDIEPRQWAKLVFNLNNAVSALSDQPLRELFATRGYRLIMADLIEEAIRVLDRTGIRPGRLGVMSVRRFPRALRLPEIVFRLLARAQAKISPEARSSMWEDLTLRRPTEVDYLNGEIVRLAEAHGIDAPLNRRMVKLVHDAEAKGSGPPGMSAESLREALVGA